jgi:hypothetical protein
LLQDFIINRFGLRNFFFALILTFAVLFLLGNNFRHCVLFLVEILEGELGWNEYKFYVLTYLLSRCCRAQWFCQQVWHRNCDQAMIF